MNIVWPKKDLRLKDHLPLWQATQNGPTIAIFIFSPKVSFHYDFDWRHWRFIYQSLKDLEKQGLLIHSFYAEPEEVFSLLIRKFKNITVFSHQETGNGLTFEMDIRLRRFFKKEGIHWYEFPNNGVLRGLKMRKGWDAYWIKYVKKPIVPSPDLNKIQVFNELNREFPLPEKIKKELESGPSSFQVGGSTLAHSELEYFALEKIENYWGNISYPEKSRYHCSRLSPYLTYGNLSIRQIYQRMNKDRVAIKNKRSLNQYLARLKWHCHFIQKLEMSPELEFQNLNPAFNSIRFKSDKELIKRWREGQTGYPLIDAAMRCVGQTGYLNFRLRSTVVSFLTHLMWQPWQKGSGHLARMFLDYEPGIHFAQFQMQAATTGINMIRIYNPIKQSKEKDPEGEFIKKWVPELGCVPTPFLHTPWEMTALEQSLYNCILGTHYPLPVVNFEASYKRAQEELWRIKKSDENKAYSKNLIVKHTRQSKRYKTKGNKR